LGIRENTFSVKRILEQVWWILLYNIGLLALMKILVSFKTVA